MDRAGLILFTLAALGLPLLGMAAWTMPPLTGHLGGTRRRPLAQLPVVFVAGGLLTLVSTPLVGRLIDRYGALPVFRCVVSLAAVMTLVVTHLPSVGLAVAPISRLVSSES